MDKNKIKKVKGKHIQVAQEGDLGNSAEDINGNNIKLIQKTSGSNAKKGLWQKWGPIGTWVGIAVTIVIAIIRCH